MPEKTITKINGEVKCYGRMPSSKKLKVMILESAESGKQEIR